MITDEENNEKKVKSKNDEFLKRKVFNINNFKNQEVGTDATITINSNYEFSTTRLSDNEVTIPYEMQSLELTTNTIPSYHK